MGAAAVVEQQGQDEEGGRLWVVGGGGGGAVAALAMAFLRASRCSLALMHGLLRSPMPEAVYCGLSPKHPSGFALYTRTPVGTVMLGKTPAKFTGFFRLDTSGLTSASTAAKSASSSTSARCLMPPPRGRCLALPPSLRVRTRSQRPRLSQWSHRNLRRMPLIWYCAATEEPRLTHRSVEALAALR